MIQARIWATRFPGKVLADLGGETVLQHVVRRCKQVGVPVIVATPDAALLSLGREYGAEVYLGDEQNVLERYIGCAKSYKLDSVVRVTADCPFIDPWVIQEALSTIPGDCDYASNVIDRTYPYGLDFEVVKTGVLERVALADDLQPKHREHVTLYIREHLDKYKTHSVINPWGNWTEHDWRLDERDDLPLLQRIYKCGGNVLRGVYEMIQCLSYGQYLRTSSEHGDSPGRPSAVDGSHAAESADASYPDARSDGDEGGYRGEGSGP